VERVRRLGGAAQRDLRWVLVYLLPPRLCRAGAGLRRQPRAEETAGRGRTGDEAIAWAEYGTPDELPTIHHRKQYLAEADVMPDYRITCIFVDKRHRGQGYAKVALAGALDLIAAQGGGVVEGYPHEIGEKRMNKLVRLQRNTHDVRASWLRVRPVQVNEEHRHAPHDPAGLNLPNLDPEKGLPLPLANRR
jgi:GNAT superfamily N-acetyltransferase